MTPQEALALITEIEMNNKIDIEEVEATEKKILSELKTKYSKSISFSETASKLAIIIVVLTIMIFPVFDLINYFNRKNRINKIKLDYSLQPVDVFETSFTNQVIRENTIVQEKIKKNKKKPKAKIWRY